MSQIKPTFKILICLYLLSSLGVAQSSGTGPGQDTIDKCQISKKENFYSPDDTKFTTTYEVDEQSRLIKKVSTYKHRNAERDFETEMTNTFDAKGFLTQRVTTNTMGDTNAYTWKSIVEKFTYADGLLKTAELSRIFKEASRNTISRTEYKYDEGGKLSERLVGTNGQEVRYTYSDAKLTGISDPNNKYVIDDKGYVTKMTKSRGGYTVYNYNAKGQPVNRITYNKNGEKAREDAYEFSAMLRKAPTNPVHLKGHPGVPAMYGNYSYLRTKYRVTYLKVAGTKPSTYETVYTNEVDRNGNLKKRTGVGGSGTSAREEITEYTYVDCK